MVDAARGGVLLRQRLRRACPARPEVPQLARVHGHDLGAAAAIRRAGARGYAMLLGQFWRKVLSNMSRRSPPAAMVLQKARVTRKTRATLTTAATTIAMTTLNDVNNYPEHDANDDNEDNNEKDDRTMTTLTTTTKTATTTRYRPVAAVFLRVCSFAPQV